MSTSLTATEKLFVTALPPFNFELSAQIFASGDSQIRTYEKGKFRQAIRIDGKVALCSVGSAGTAENPKLLVEVKTKSRLTAKQNEKAAETVKALFNLDFDLTAFYEDTRNDEVMARLTRKLFGLKSPTTQFAFEALVDSIVEQQISLKVANILEKKLIKQWGDTLNLRWGSVLCLPDPEKLSCRKPTGTAQCGLEPEKSRIHKKRRHPHRRRETEFGNAKNLPKPRRHHQEA